MKIKLTEAACDVIRDEAKDQMPWVIRERYSQRGKDEGEKQTARLLQIADILAATEEPEFSDHDGTAEIKFTEEALIWLTRAAKESRQQLEQVDENGELTVALAGRDAYLLWVCDRIVRAAR